MDAKKIVEMIEAHHPTIQHFGWGRYSFTQQLDNGSLASGEGTFTEAATQWAEAVVEYHSG